MTDSTPQPVVGARKRYLTMLDSEARAFGYSGIDNPDYQGYEDHRVLVDGERSAVVWHDGPERHQPEDFNLYRDLSEFIEELNRLAEEPTPEEPIQPAAGQDAEVWELLRSDMFTAAVWEEAHDAITDLITEQRAEAVAEYAEFDERRWRWTLTARRVRHQQGRRDTP